MIDHIQEFLTGTREAPDHDRVLATVLFTDIVAATTHAERLGDRNWRGVRCALAIRDVVRTLGLEVRAGVHIGECELMGEKVGGIAVHTAARIMAKSRPAAYWYRGQSRTSWPARAWYSRRPGGTHCEASPRNGTCTSQ